MKFRKMLASGFVLYSRMIRALSINGRIIPPPLITWEPTMKCNLKCRMCFFYGEHGIRPDLSGELSKDEAIRAVDKILSHYRYMPFKPFFGFTGGEPFLRTDFLEILAYLKSKNVKFSITSNFSTLDKHKIKELAEVKPNDIRISLDGPRNIHDSIRGVRGLFDKVINSVSELRKIDKSITVKFNCTITKDNIDHLKDVVEIAKKVKADLTLQHLWFMEPEFDAIHNKAMKASFGVHIDRLATLEKFSEKEAGHFYQKIKEIAEEAKRDKKIKIIFVPNVPLGKIEDYYLDMGKYSKGKKCNYIFGSIRINSRGELYHCYDYPFGNILKNSYMQILNNRKAREFRKRIKKGLLPCCKRCCKD